MYCIWTSHCQNLSILGANSIGILNIHTQLRLASKVRGLGHRKHWHPERQSSHTGRFLLVVALKGLYYCIVQCQLININKLAFGEE
jgi:hypothetical protein